MNFLRSVQEITFASTLQVRGLNISRAALNSGSRVAVLIVCVASQGIRECGRGKEIATRRSKARQ